MKELVMTISTTKTGLVRLEFSEPVMWFAVRRGQARELAALLVKHTKVKRPAAARHK